MPAAPHNYFNYTNSFLVETEALKFLTSLLCVSFLNNHCPDLIHYSVRKLFTGLSKAALAVCKQINTVVIIAKMIVAITNGCAVTDIRYA